MWHQPCQRCNYTISVDIQKKKKKRRRRKRKEKKKKKKKEEEEKEKKKKEEEEKEKKKKKKKKKKKRKKKEKKKKKKRRRRRRKKKKKKKKRALKLFTHVESHASAVSLLENREQRNIKAINKQNKNYMNAADPLKASYRDRDSVENTFSVGVLLFFFVVVVF